MFRSWQSQETSGNIVIDTATGTNPLLDFADAVCAGLEKRPRSIPCRFLYDARGSALFEAICRQPEYYPTRTEAAILRDHAPAIAEHTGPLSLAELGSGTSVKTRHILRAYLEHTASPLYVPIDVSEAALKEARSKLARELPEVRMTGLVGPYEKAFELLEEISPVLVIFLGSTIGNFDPQEADRFLADLAAHMKNGDHLLLGVDLDKDAGVLEAAYNDAAGVTADFTLNLFARMNRELGSHLDLDSIKHEAFYDREHLRIEIYARFLARQELRVEPLDRSFQIEAGERIRTEISRKFRLADLTQELTRHGFVLRSLHEDCRRWFALLLLKKRSNDV